MDSKFIAIIAVAVVVVAAGGAGAFMFLKGDDKVDNDYTILDDNKNIKEGLVFNVDSKTLKVNGGSKIVVTSVADGKVYYNLTLNMNIVQEVDSEEVLGLIPFDLKDSSTYPEGVTVTPEDSTYTINGECTLTKADKAEFKFDNLKVTLNADDEVISVEGKESNKGIDLETGEVLMTIDVTYSTKDSVMTGKADSAMTGKQNAPVDNFYNVALNTFEEQCGPKGDFEHAKISEPKDVKFGNVNAKSYDLTGDCGQFGENANITVIVYDGYIINVDGENYYHVDIHY